MSDPLQPASLRVPCSTSNLGSGFDTIGLALDRYLDVSFEPGDDEGLVLQREGTLAPLAQHEGPDLVATAFERGFENEDPGPHGILRLRSNIPIARGLGSSAAAILAGYDLSRAVRGLPRDDAGAFAAAHRHEGHADNAAPSLYGGLRAVAVTLDGPRVIELTLSPDVGFAYAAPAQGSRTDAARRVLPATVPHRTAAGALGRVTALVSGLANADAELIRIGVEDDLHVPHRLSMIPNAPAAMGAGYEAGAWAVTISGAGSGLIAMCEPSNTQPVADAMREMFSVATDDPECVGYSVRPDLAGLRRL